MPRLTYRYKLQPLAPQYASLRSARFHLKELRNAALQERIESYTAAQYHAFTAGRAKPNQADWIAVRSHEIADYMLWQAKNEQSIRRQNDGKTFARWNRYCAPFERAKRPLSGPLPKPPTPWKPLTLEEVQRLHSTSPSALSQQRCLAELRSADPHGIGRLPRHILVYGLRTVESSMQAFFRRCAAGETPGFPRFKNFDRIRTIECGYGKGISFGLTKRDAEGHITSCTLRSTIWHGELKVAMHRPMPDKPKHVSLTYDGRFWYACFTIETAQNAIPTHQYPHTVIGVDLGVNRLITLDTGDFVTNPLYERTAAPARRKIERRLAKAPRGSRAHQKAKRALARIHRRMRNQRATFRHTLTKHLANRAETIVFENLQIPNMVRSAKGTIDQPGRNVRAKAGLNRAIHDSGLSTVVKTTRYKAESAGGRVLLVDPRNTSLECSACGAESRKVVYDLHDCPACGLKLHRDHNAAVNVRDRGIKILGPSFHATRRGALPTGLKADGQKPSAGSENGSNVRSERVEEKNSAFSLRG